MVRRTLAISNIRFIADFYKASDELNKIYRKYVMLRKYNIIDGVVHDTDIYFIDANVIDKVLYELTYNDGLTDQIVFPNVGIGYTSFSKSITAFNSNIYTDYLAFNPDLYNNEIYKLYDKDALLQAINNRQEHLDANPELAENNDDYVNDIDKLFEEELDAAQAGILCDKIRLYHPHNMSDYNGIVYIDNYVNNIHFHFYCQLYNNIPTNSETEFSVHNCYYSEFVDLYIPNLEYLFSGKVFYKEDLFIGKDGTAKVLFDANGPYQFMDFQSFSLPFMLQTNDEGYQEKVFIKDYTAEVNKSLNMYYPITLTLYTIDINSSNTPNYTKHPSINLSSETFQTGYNITLCSELGFDIQTHIISVINKFVYPKELGNDIEEAYCKMHNIRLVRDGEVINDGMIKKTDYASFEYDEFDVDETHQIGDLVKCIGYQFEIASDKNFNNIIWSKVIEVDPPTSEETEEPLIEDFAFNLNELFTNWAQLPDNLTLRAVFIDKYLGNIYCSNFVPITKEKFKYFINTSNMGVINNDTVEYTEQKTYRLDMSQIDTTNPFINSIKCIVHNNTEAKQATVSANAKANQKIIYKPIFYRTQDLQSIKLRDAVTQNIGINLGNYMTKVGTFKLNINGKQYIESARNDVFVIFSIEATTFTATSGKYDVVNQDDEYISSGIWQIV